MSPFDLQIPPAAVSSSKSAHGESSAVAAKAESASAAALSPGSAGVAFDSVKSLKDDHVKSEEVNEVASSKQQKREEKQVDVDLGALKSVSRLHARIG
jgi:hypothetical protein